MNKNILILSDPSDRGVLFLNATITLRVIFTITLTAVIIYITRLFIPDDVLSPTIVKQINDTFLIPAGYFAPEQKERTSYILALLLIPFISTLISIAAWHFGKKNKISWWLWNVSLNPLWKWVEISWFPVFLIIIRDFASESPFGVTFSIVNYSIIQSLAFSQEVPKFLCFSICIIVTGFVVFFKKPEKLSTIYSKRTISFLIDIISIFLILTVALRLSVIPETIGVSGPSPSLIHIGPIFEPAAVSYLSTATTGVNLPSQYGGLIEFARPFLFISSGDPIGLLWFAYFSLLVSLVCIWLTARRLLAGNAVLGLIALSAIIYLTSIKLKPFTCYQCANFRWFWPSIFLFLAVMELPSRVKLFLIPYFLFPFAIYWNPETGLASMAAWVGWRIILHFINLINSPGKLVSIIKTLKFFGMGVIGFISGAILLSSYIYLKSGNLPDFTLLFQYANYFYQQGFGMIPMPPYHLWNIYVLIAVALFTIGIQFNLTHPTTTSGLVRRNSDFLIFSSLLFGLLFAYYQGRSYYESLLVISYPLGLALVSWLGLGMTGTPADSQFPYRSRAQLYGLLLIIFGVSSSGMAITHYPLPVHPSPFTRHDAEGKQSLKDFVRRTADGKQPIFISFNAWRYTLLTQQTPGADVVPLAAIILRDQFEKYLEYLEKPELAVYFDLNNEEIFQFENTSWRQPLLEKLRQSFIIENIPEDDFFIGTQGRLVRLRNK